MSSLLTEELRKALPKLCAQEGSADPIVFAKFFFPASGWTWFVTEGETRGDDFLFFGYVVGFESELGHFSLSELEDVGIHGVRVERVEAFAPAKLSECLQNPKAL